MCGLVPQQRKRPKITAGLLEKEAGAHTDTGALLPNIPQIPCFTEADYFNVSLRVYEDFYGFRLDSESEK